MQNLSILVRTLCISVVIAGSSLLLSQCSPPSVGLEPTTAIDSELLKFAVAHHMKLAKQDLSTKPLLSFASPQAAKAYFKTNPNGLRLNLRKMPFKDKTLEKARLAQGVYYSSGT
ncbi:hypothetical protein G8759_13625 [Spirosoma aureum]|uniref:Uncharacterized protein n=1 Tax=Spirosoma aureum TaxID=2692134 RepID=A0A6G9AME9_9BACT|nr:hypothetical protein [Spirosoma aureum]QIP13588.1 hypothetical protein G8759_13625 [Spirosoma aureum]